MDNTILIGIAGTICSMIFAYLGYQRGLKTDASEDGALKSSVEYIRKRIDDVFLEQRELNRTVNAHAERLTRVEESTKQAHKRLDEFSGK